MSYKNNDKIFNISTACVIIKNACFSMLRKNKKRFPMHIKNFYETNHYCKESAYEHE